MPDLTSGRLWHLPGWTPPPERAVSEAESAAGDTGWHEWTDTSGRVLRTPRLTDAEAADIASAVRRAARMARETHDHRQVVRAVSRAALRLANGMDPLGLEALEALMSATGWSREVARATLAGMSAEWEEDSLHALVRSELGDPSLLDGFAVDPSRDGRRRKATGAPLLLQVHAGNVPGVPISGAILGLIARSGVLAKTGSDEPGLLPLFARALAEEDDLLSASLAVTWWPGEETPPALDRWVKEISKAIVYGGDEAVAAIRQRLPAHAGLVAYGPRTGVAVLLEDADVEQAGAGLARDVCAYEQRGCVSPRLAFVIGSNPWPAAEAIAAHLASETVRLGPPPLTAGEAVAIRSARAEFEFYGIETGKARMFGSKDLSWSVLARSEGDAASVVLPRTVWLYAVKDLDELAARLAPLAGRIQSLGYAGEADSEALARLAAELGVSRVAPLGDMAWPPVDWRHDGRHRLLPLLSWTDWERRP